MQVNLPVMSSLGCLSSPGCCDHVLVEFTVLKDKGQARSRTRTLNFVQADFQLHRELVSRTPWEKICKDREQSRAVRSLRMLP